MFAGAGTKGSKDGEKLKATFSSPSGITIDQKTGTIYVSDKGAHTIRKITPEGISFFIFLFFLPPNIINLFCLGAVSTIAGMAGKRGFADGVGKGARFESPKGIFYSDKYKAVFVCDYGNDKLRMVNVSDGIFILFSIYFVYIFIECSF